MTPTVKPEEAVDVAHPSGVAAGEIVVHRHDVHARAGQRVQVGRQRGHQRLTFAGAHFGNLAVVQHHAADQLHVEMAHVQRALAGFAHDGECFGQQIVERFALGQTLLELVRLGAQFARRSSASICGSRALMARTACM